MAPQDQLADERRKSKLKHRGGNVESSPRPKFKREKVSKNSDAKSDSSTFQRCKKLVSLKRFSAQDRLKRIRSNIPLQNKIIDQVCSETVVNTRDESEGKNTEISTNTCDDVNKNVQVSQKKSVHDCKNVSEEIATHSMPKSKYSADSRLKKIKAAFQKKIMNRKPAEPKTEKNVLDECHAKKTACSVSSIEKCIEKKSSNEPLESNLENDSCMDIDLDCDFSYDVPGDANHYNAVPERNASSPPENSYIAEEICTLRKERAYLALHESFAPDFVMNLAVPLGDIFIVVDTNILLSDLSLVRRLLISDIPPYKCPVVVIPWLVLQEIDYAIKKNDTKLLPRAKAANAFLYEYLKKKHPRLFGQSLEDFKQTFKNAVSVDDCILQYCLKFTSLEKNVILLTDDINLCNKSMVNNLSVFTKKEFERNFFLTEK